MVQQKLFEFEVDRSRMLVGLPLSASAKLLLIVLDAIIRSDDFCCPSLSSLAELMGCSEHVARQAVRESERAGFIEVEKYPGRTTSYRIEWSAITPEESEKFNVNRYL